MNAWTHATVVNVIIASAVGVACYVAGSAWPLLGLVFLRDVMVTQKRDE